MNKDVYQVKVIYTDAGNKTEGKPYRIIQFYKDTNLQQFAMHILKNFGFKLAEPFGFYDDVENWHKSEHKFELFEEDPKKNTIKNTFIDELFDIQDNFLLVYDYLEEFRFLIFLEKQVPERNVQYPEVLESRGETVQKSENSFSIDDEDDSPKFGAKKTTGGFKDEFDDIDDDDLDKLDGREGDDDDDILADDATEDFGLDEYGAGGYDDIK